MTVEAKTPSTVNAPEVDPYTEGNPAITGKADAGDTIRVFDSDSKQVGADAVVNAAGEYSVPVSGLVAGDKLTVVAYNGSNPSSATPLTVDPKASEVETPTISVVSEVDSIVTGTGTPGSTVELRDTPATTGATLSSITVGGTGEYEFTEVGPFTVGEMLYVVAKVGDVKSQVASTKVVPNDADITIDPLKAGTNVVTGDATAAYALLRVTDQNGATLVSGNANGNGGFTLTLSRNLVAGDTVTVTNLTTKGSTTAEVPIPPKSVAKPTVHDLTSTGFDGTARAGATIRAFLKGTQQEVGNALVNSDGTYKLTFSSPQAGGTALDIVAEYATVRSDTVPETIPVVNTATIVNNGNMYSIFGKVTPNEGETGFDTVYVTIEGQSTPIALASIDDDGTYIMHLQGNIPAGSSIQVYAGKSDDANATSNISNLIVPDELIPSVVAGDSRITGTLLNPGTANGDTTLYKVDSNGKITGNPLGIGLVNEDGTGYYVDPSNALTPGNYGIVVEGHKNVIPLTVISKLTELPKITATSKSISGTAIAGQIVTAQYEKAPDFARATIANADGSYEIPLSTAYTPAKGDKFVMTFTDPTTGIAEVRELTVS